MISAAHRVPQFDPQLFRQRMLELADCSFADFAPKIIFPPESPLPALVGLAVQRTDQALDLTNLNHIIINVGLGKAPLSDLNEEVATLHGNAISAALIMKWQQPAGKIQELFMNRFRAIFEHMLNMSAVNEMRETAAPRYPREVTKGLCSGLLRSLYDYCPANERINVIQSCTTHFVNEYCGSGETLLATLQHLELMISEIDPGMEQTWFSGQSAISLAVKIADYGVSAAAWADAVQFLRLDPQDAYCALKDAWIDGSENMLTRGSTDLLLRLSVTNRFKLLQELRPDDAETTLVEFISDQNAPGHLRVLPTDRNAPEMIRDLIALCKGDRTDSLVCQVVKECCSRELAPSMWEPGEAHRAGSLQAWVALADDLGIDVQPSQYHHATRAPLAYATSINNSSLSRLVALVQRAITAALPSWFISVSGS